MAKKPRDYAAEYARRQAKGRAAGKSRQAARGHKPAEHIQRRESNIRRQEMLGGLTAAERATVRGFIRRLHEKAGWIGDVDDMIEEALAYARDEGMAKFRAEMAFRREMIGNPGTVDIGYLERRSAENGFPDHRWYFYNFRKEGLRRRAA